MRQFSISYLKINTKVVDSWKRSLTKTFLEDITKWLDEESPVQYYLLRFLENFRQSAT